MTDLEPAKDRRVWVLRGVTDEAFWRSVMAQTIAGVIVATVAALYVAASGYLPVSCGPQSGLASR